MAEFKCGFVVFVYVTHLVVFSMIFIEFDIHNKCINIGLPTNPLVEGRVLVKQHYWLEWPNPSHSSRYQIFVLGLIMWD